MAQLRAERDAALARVDSLTATLEHARQALLEAQELQQRDAAEIARLEMLCCEVVDWDLCILTAPFADRLTPASDAGRARRNAAGIRQKRPAVLRYLEPCSACNGTRRIADVVCPECDECPRREELVSVYGPESFRPHGRGCRCES